MYTIKLILGLVVVLVFNFGVIYIVMKVIGLGKYAKYVFTIPINLIRKLATALAFVLKGIIKFDKWMKPEKTPSLFPGKVKNREPKNLYQDTRRR